MKAYRVQIACKICVLGLRYNCVTRGITLQILLLQVHRHIKTNSYPIKQLCHEGKGELLYKLGGKQKYFRTYRDDEPSGVLY